MGELQDPILENSRAEISLIYYYILEINNRKDN
jgi:hypothetical protein